MSRWLKLTVAAWLLAGGGLAADAAETVVTAVHSSTANGYKRARLADGSFKPEFYRFANGGRISGTESDATVDRVTFAEVAAVARRALAQQNYHYARNPAEAEQLIILYWGSTRGYNRVNYGSSVTEAASAMSALNALGAEVEGGGPDPVRDAAKAAVETAFIKIAMENQVRDHINVANARILGYIDEINDADGPQRLSAGADRYNDLLADIEEPRYYIVIVAYDMAQMEKKRDARLLWVTRVSVRLPGNGFDDSMAAMLRSAAKHLGQASRRLIRGEESKGIVELGDLKFLGEAKDTEVRPAPAPAGGSEK